jgi:hypothetical protein
VKNTKVVIDFLTLPVGMCKFSLNEFEYEAKGSGKRVFSMISSSAMTCESSA